MGFVSSLVCTDDSHCTQCSSGVIGNCEFNLTTRIYSCHCDSPNCKAADDNDIFLAIKR